MSSTGDNENGAKDRLKIKPVKNNSKDKIPQPDLAKEYVIPRINTSNIFVGSTGMGKSTLISNLLTKEQFFGGKQKNGKPWFDHVLLVSPTGDSDDVQRELNLPEDAVFTDLEEVPEMLQVLMKEQKRKIKELGADKAPRVLLFYDDVISHPKLMSNKYFMKSFIANRHHNFTVFLASQSWTKIPRAIRLQSRGLFYFAGSMSEVDLLCDEYCPPGLQRHDFRNMIDYATRDPYSFLYINKSVPMKRRFRRNLSEIIQASFFKNSKKNKEFRLPDQMAEDNSNPSKEPEEENKEEGDIPREEYQDAVVNTEAQQGQAGYGGRKDHKRRRRNLEQRQDQDYGAPQQKRHSGRGFRPRRIEPRYYT